MLPLPLWLAWFSFSSPLLPLRQACGRCGDGIWVLAQRVALMGWMEMVEYSLLWLFLFLFDWLKSACELARCGGTNDWGKWTVAVCPVAIVPLLSPYPFSPRPEILLTYWAWSMCFVQSSWNMYSVFKSHLRLCLVLHLKNLHPSHQIFGHMHGTLNIDKK